MTSPRILLGADRRKKLVIPGTGGAVGPTATRPISPSTYTLPGTIVAVSTMAQLRTAISSGTPANIVLEDGVYADAGSYLTLGAAHKLYARNLLGAEIQNGFQTNRANVTLQGLKFNVTDTAKALNGIGAHFWGSSSGANVLDCEFYGNDTMSAGMSLKSNTALEGSTVQRCRAHNFHEFGFLIDSNDTAYVPTVGPVISDLYAENAVWQTNPQGSNGVSEAGVCIGNKCTSVDRIWCHQTPGYSTVGARGQLKAWYGVLCHTAFRATTINDVYVDGMVAFAVYFEHRINEGDSGTVTINRMETAKPVNVGFHAEWRHQTPTVETETVQNVIINNSFIDSSCTGVHYDQGTKNCTVKNTKFYNQRFACISNYLEDAVLPNLYDTTGNDYTGRMAGAATVTTAQAGLSSCWNNDTFD